MKIGILTFHCAHNYGAVLQAYALANYLKENGHKVEIIDYRPKSIVDAHGTIPKGRIRKLHMIRKVIFIIKILPFLYSRYIRSSKFNRFISSLPLSDIKYVYSDKEIKGYDYILVGSDQVWNSKITDGFDPFYTGRIFSKAKYISYAASAEIAPNNKEMNKYKSVLDGFFKISVRESLFRNQLQPLTDKEIKQVLDPVFLLDKNEWLKFGIPPFKEKDYILVYQVKRDKNVIRYANELAQYNKCEVVEITAEADFLPSSKRHTMLSPREFVGAFVNARCVVTTSFHGTAFACIFEKPVKTMLFNKPGDYRAIDLLKTIGINNSTITPDSVGQIPIPSFDKALNLDYMINESKKFLKFK